MNFSSCRNYHFMELISQYSFQMSVFTEIIQFLSSHAIPIQVMDTNTIQSDEPQIQIHVIDTQSFENKIRLDLLRENAILQGFRFIMIPEQLWHKKTELVQNRLLSLWKIRKRILAKDCLIDRVDKEIAYDFLEKNHFFGACDSKHRLGLYNKQGELQALATFAKPRLMNYERIPYYSHEWLRYASLSNTTVVGAMGKLLQSFLLETKAQHVMTYADLNWGTGHSFEKLGFKSHSIKTDLGVAMGASLKYTLDLRTHETAF